MSEELRKTECHNFEKKHRSWYTSCMSVLALNDAGLAWTPFISVDKQFYYCRQPLLSCIYVCIY